MTTDERFIDFLREEMRRRDFTSVRQFSAWLGMSNSMVAHVIDGRRDPGLDFMVAVSQKTGVGLADLVELAKPGTLDHTDLSLDARILAQQIEGLEDDERAMVRAILRGARYGEGTKNRK